MPTLSHIAQLDTVFDALAIAASVLMIFLLVHNRLRYGRLFLDARRVGGKGAFSGEMSVQMMYQQSQRAYENLHRSLVREFETLRNIGGECPPLREDDRSFTDSGSPGPAVTGAMPGWTAENRGHRYRMATEMIARGEAAQKILRQCRLTGGELELLEGLQQLEGGCPSAG